MNKINHLLKETKGIAFEFFPPKTEKGEVNLFDHLKKLEEITPAYVSVTYGAGGSNRKKTHEIVTRIAEEEKLTVMAHLTTIGHKQNEIKEIVDSYKNSGIQNIMALRGDTPKDSDIQPEDGDFPHAYHLIRFLKENYGDYFSIGGAAFPEYHPESPDKDTDMKYFKQKADTGLDFAVTQMFFNNDHFFSLIDRSQKWGINIPILPGIMPLTNFNQIQRFKELSNAEIPSSLIEKVERAGDNSDEVYKIGVDFTIKQCEELIRQGFHFLHFFTLNKSNASLDIIHAIQNLL